MRHIRSKNKGFNLIELMIVVAIVGILAMVAIPQYANYTQRSIVTGALAGIASYKTAVAFCYQNKGTMSGCDSGLEGVPLGISQGDNGATINYVDHLYAMDGVIHLLTTAKQSNGTLLKLVLTPFYKDIGISWKLSGSGCNADVASIAASSTNKAVSPTVGTPGRGINCS